MKNEYEIRGEVTAIIINSPKYGRQEAIISTSKLDRVKEFPNTWLVYYENHTKSLYVMGNAPKENGKRKSIYLHRWVTNSPDGMQVDHINHNSLENTDSNLRIVTLAENMQNKNTYTNNTSGVRGVIWDKESNKWYARVGVKNKKKSIGRFDTIEEAEKAVIEARKKYMPYSQESTAYIAKH